MPQRALDKFSQAFVKLTSRKCLFLSSISKLFLGGFERFQELARRKFAFSRFKGLQIYAGLPRRS
jgi:hypothetical protein